MLYKKYIYSLNSSNRCLFVYNSFIIAFLYKNLNDNYVYINNERCEKSVNHEGFIFFLIISIVL